MTAMEIYREAKAEMVVHLRGIDRETLHATCDACPDWSIKDTVAHHGHAQRSLVDGTFPSDAITAITSGDSDERAGPATSATGAEQVELPGSDGRRRGHGGRDGWFDADHHPGGFDPEEGIVGRFGVGGHGVACELQRHDWIRLDIVPGRSAIARARCHAESSSERLGDCAVAKMALNGTLRLPSGCAYARRRDCTSASFACRTSASR